MNPDQLHSLNSLRLLSIDMITCAKSGHPGICLGAAPIMHSLYSNFLKVNPRDPMWPNRDRFVMSAGHGSALLYATLFMAGFDISIDDLVNFRRIDSKTPGHPELGKTPGVEVSTGMLGQGFANAVGMAIAEKYIQGILEEHMPKQKLINYKVYCLVGDGDLQEGVANEAASIAGNLALDNLIVIYDSNDNTLDGSTKISSCDDTVKKFINMGWEVDYLTEGNDIREIDKAIERLNAAYMLLIPKLPPININASANNIILHITIIIPVSIPSKLFITSANPETPPHAISLGKKKNSNENITINTPKVIMPYSFNVFILSSLVY